MRRLSEFLANHINRIRGNCIPVSNIASGIAAYKKHLQDDIPKTVQWAMVEKQLVTALEHMEALNKSGDETQAAEDTLKEFTGSVYCPHICEFLNKRNGEIDTTKCDFNVRVVKECSRVCVINTEQAERNEDGSPYNVGESGIGETITCDNCGAKVIRNGACMKCFSCGNSIGCS